MWHALSLKTHEQNYARENKYEPDYNKYRLTKEYKHGSYQPTTMCFLQWITKQETIEFGMIKYEVST